MLVEIAGLPGSGKTTLFRNLRAELMRMDLPVTDINTIADVRDSAEAVPRFVSRKPQRELLYRFWRFQSQNPGLMRRIDSLYRSGDIKQFLFMLLATHFQAGTDQVEEDEIVMTDEGFLTHIVALFCKRGDRKDFDSLIDEVPAADLLIHLNASADVAHARAVARRGPGRAARQMVESKLGGKRLFATRQSLLERGVQLYARRCRAVIEVDASLDSQTAARRAACEIAAQRQNLSRTVA